MTDEFDKALAVIAPKMKRATRALASNHRLWYRTITLRQGRRSWGDILKLRPGARLPADRRREHLRLTLVI